MELQRICRQVDNKKGFTRAYIQLPDITDAYTCWKQSVEVVEPAPQGPSFNSIHVSTNPHSRVTEPQYIRSKPYSRITTPSIKRRNWSPEPDSNLTGFYFHIFKKCGDMVQLC